MGLLLNNIDLFFHPHLEHLKTIFGKSPLAKNFLVLLSGGFVAQVIPALLSPILSRLYNPGQFGEFGFWSNLANTLAIVSTLRYEMAIVLPKEDEDAQKLLKGSWMIALLVAIISGLLTYLFIPNLTNAGLTAELVAILTGLYVFLTGINQSINYWFIRKKAFRKTSLNKIVQSFSISFFSLLFGFYCIANGLIFAYALGAIFLSVFSVWQAGIGDLKLGQFEINKEWKELWKYKEFPIFTALPALFNGISITIPVFIILHYFDATQSGYYSFVRQVIFVPLAFVTAMIAQVTFSETSEKIRNKQSIKRNLIQVVLWLLIPAIVGLVVLNVWGPYWFSILFGEQWRTAGKLAGMMMVSIGIQAIVSPISPTLTALNKVKILGLWQLGFCLLTSCLYFFIHLPFEQFLQLSILFDSTAYTIYGLLIFWQTMRYENQLRTL